MEQSIAIEERKLHCHIEKEKQLEYIEVPFQMPSKVNKIHVKYWITNHSDQEAVVDLGMKDRYRVRGWSGGARKQIEIGVTSATPGYLSGSLEEGEWAVLLGAYKIPEDGLDVEIVLQFERNIDDKRFWLKGDFHMHSVHSDGTYELEEAVAIAWEKGLDFIALTDHNTVSQNFAELEDENLTIIPGMELTTYHGHCNFFGVKDPVKDFRVLSVPELQEKIIEATNLGAKVSINHPHDPGCPWEWGWDLDYNWVEVWNGPWRPGNQKTLDWWQQELIKGNKIVVIGGSDTHRPDPYVQHGMPTTWVKTNGRTQEEIFHAIDRGHVFISYCPEGPTIDLTCGDKEMGDTVADRENPLRFIVDHVKDGDQIKVISDKGLEKTYTIQDKPYTLRDQINITNQSFIRIEVWRYFPQVGQFLMAAMCNPLYIDIKGM